MRQRVKIDFCHCVKYRNFTQSPGLEILWKGTVSTKLRVNHPKLCGNFAFPQNFHARKLSRVTVFHAVFSIPAGYHMILYSVAVVHSKGKTLKQLMECPIYFGDGEVKMMICILGEFLQFLLRSNLWTLCRLENGMLHDVKDGDHVRRRLFSMWYRLDVMYTVYIVRFIF